MNRQTVKNRYPGIKPYSIDDKDIFFGRDKEISELYTLLEDKNIVVMHGKSGYGKSSLLSAGLIPKLTENNYFNLVIRLNVYNKATNTAPLETIINKTQPFLGKENFYNKIQLGKIDLWLFFKNIQFTYGQKIVLIFDQFEELNTFPKEKINQFKQEFAKVLYSNIPQEIRNYVSDKYRENKFFLTDDEFEELSLPLKIKILFVLRTDKVGFLIDLSDYLVDINKKNNWYNLDALDREQAEDALLFPAEINNPNFISPRFSFSNYAVEKIFKHLTDKEQKVESFQLQIICQFCENIILKRLEKNPTTERPQIDDEDLGSLENIFIGYYKTILDELPSHFKKSAVTELIEEQLIIDEQRISLPAALILRPNNQKKGITNELLKYLQNVHLIRAEPNNLGTVNYEISHDTLIVPILEMKKIRTDIEKKIKEEADRKSQEESQRFERERRRKEWERKLYKRFATALSVLLIAFLYLSFIFFNQKEELLAQKEDLVRLNNDNLDKLEQYEAIELNYGNILGCVVDSTLTPIPNIWVHYCLKNKETIHTLEEISVLDSILTDTNGRFYIKTPSAYNQNIDSLHKNWSSCSIYVQHIDYKKYTATLPLSILIFTEIILHKKETVSAQQFLKEAKEETATNIENAIIKFENASNEGSIEALTELGKIYLSNKNTSDYVKAFSYFTRAALRGNSEAQFELGNMYFRGLGIPKDFVEALNWYTKAAQQEHVGAQFSLGKMFEEGYVMESRTDAVRWYRAAAIQGHTGAQFQLANLLHNTGGQEAYEEAFSWYKMIAENDTSSMQSQGQYSVGTMYYLGRGVSKDKQQAKIWYEKAKAKGNKNAMEALEKFF